MSNKPVFPVRYNLGLYTALQGQYDEENRLFTFNFNRKSFEYTRSRRFLFLNISSCSGDIYL